MTLILPPTLRVELPPPARVAWKPADDKRPEPKDWRDADKAPDKAAPCRWVEGWGYYLREHEPTCRDRACNGCKECTHDSHGTPVRHCKAERCTEHLATGQRLHCPRCLARVRANLAHIERLAALMPDEAAWDGIDSTAAMLAGPVADPTKIWRRVILYAEATLVTDPAKRERATRAMVAFDADNRDEQHPLYVLWTWERMIREDYGHDTAKAVTLSTSVSYLSWVLTDMAQDPEQDFALFADEVSECVSYLEAVLGASRTPERGAPCWRCPAHRETCEKPECEGCRPRLVRKRAHWCDKDDCKREHDATGARDTWVCPTNREHWWTEADYRKSTYEDAVAEGMTPRRARPA